MGDKRCQEGDKRCQEPFPEGPMKMLQQTTVPDTFSPPTFSPLQCCLRKDCAMNHVGKGYRRGRR